MHNYAGNSAVYPANIGLVDDADLNPATASALDVAPTNLADRTAWLHANAILVTGGVITGDLEFAAGSFLTVDASAHFQLFGLQEVESGAALQFDVGSQLNGTAGGTFTYAAGSILNLAGLVALPTGAAIVMQAGSTLTVPTFPTFLTNVVDARVRSFMEAQPSGTTTQLWVSGAAGKSNMTASLVATTTSIIMDLPTHNGARLDTITVTFSVGQDHAGKPDASGGHFPRFKVARYAHGVAFSLQYLIIAGFVEIAGGGYADGHAWYAGGANQTFTITLDQNNVIDTSAYAYSIEVIDEIGANALNLNTFASMRCNYSAISSLKWA